MKFWNSTIRVLLLILLCSGLNSCPAEGDIEYLAVVESNTGWELIAGDQRMEGFGDQFVYLPQNIPPVCVTVRKLSIPGYLRVQVKTEGFSIMGVRDGEWQYTTADSGSVTACSDD